MANSSKFIKDYKLDVETNDGRIATIVPDLTMEFDVSKNTGSQPNSATITIYNLGETLRSSIFKDIVDMESVSNFRSIKLSAGYKYPKIMSEIFNGSVKKAYSTRERTEFKTVIEAWEQYITPSGGPVSYAPKAGATPREILAILSAQFPNVKSTILGGMLDKVKSTRGQVLFGDAYEIIKELTNNRVYLDDGNLCVLLDQEVVAAPLEYVDASTGLLGTPRRGDGVVEIDMIFEPRLKVGQQLSVISGTEKRFAGTYKVMGFTHRGMISSSMDAPCITTVVLWAAGKFTTVHGVPANKGI